jgi:transcription elongation GreA/GreB family factor
MNPFLMIKEGLLHSIALASPLGRGLLGKVCDYEIEVDQGGGSKAYTVVAVA